MSDEFKSAYEIAMEKLRAKGLAGDGKVLSTKQKEGIAEVRRDVEARRAEARILHRHALEKARAEGDSEKVSLLEGEHERELGKLEDEERRRIDEIRAESPE